MFLILISFVIQSIFKLNFCKNSIFKTILSLPNNKTIKNHILPVTIKRIKLPYRQKKPYLLITISGDPILYKNNIIYFKTGPIQLQIERQKIIILFNVLLLGKNETVLRMPFL